MPKADKKKLFDNSDSDEDDGDNIKINKNYAQRYDEWREAEIKKKLEDRYGNLDEQLSSSSSDDEEDPQELEKALSKDFFEVISQLRKKDPKIYNPEVRFFNAEEQPSTSQGKKKKDKPIYLRDYERKLIVERGGVISDTESDSEDHKRPASPSLAEKERSLKESFAKIVHSDSDDDGDLLTKKVKTDEEKKKEDDDYLEWLRGRKEELNDKSLQESLSYLKEEWSNPKLDEGEKFLRDYILNKRYLGPGDDDADTGNITDEDYQDEYMDEFERKYNFRFEEPDSEFVKRYPRTIESSVRKQDDRRKRHRDEVKKRKEEEKLRQREELKVLKSLKRKEILKKIEKIKEITGNAELGISDKDLEEDYDPEEHDRRMNELFNDDYYKEGDDEMNLEDLPLPPLEDDLVDDYENWDEYEGEKQEELHCEDPDFNMDCDYDPETARLAKEAQPKSSRERRKLKRQSRFGTLVRKKKPEFDPNERTFQQYVDEYYGIDYEDIIGGQACRFKYRKVMPNSFGLTIEEILAADDKELNAWVSIKKATALRPDHVELNEKRIYELKAQNEELKRKILPSLYKHETEDNNEEKEGRPGSKNKKKSFKEENLFTLKEKDQSQTENEATPIKKEEKPNKEALNTNSEDISLKSHKNKKTDANKAVSTRHEKNASLENKKNKRGLNKPAEVEVTADEVGGGTRKMEEGKVQVKNLGRRQKKKLKQLSKKMASSNDSASVSVNKDHQERKSKKRSADAMNESTNHVGSDVNSNPETKKKQQESGKAPKRVKLDNKIPGQSPKKIFARNGNQPRSSDQNQNKDTNNKNEKNRVLQNPISSSRKSRMRRGKERLRVKLLQKNASGASRDVKAENKARALKKQNSKPAPVLGAMSDSRLKAYGLNPKKFKNKLMYT